MELRLKIWGFASVVDNGPRAVIVKLTARPYYQAAIPADEESGTPDQPEAIRFRLSFSSRAYRIITFSINHEARQEAIRLYPNVLQYNNGPPVRFNAEFDEIWMDATSLLSAARHLEDVDALELQGFRDIRQLMTQGVDPRCTMMVFLKQRLFTGIDMARCVSMPCPIPLERLIMLDLSHILMHSVFKVGIIAAEEGREVTDLDVHVQQLLFDEHEQLLDMIRGHLEVLD